MRLLSFFRFPQFMRTLFLFLFISHALFAASSPSESGNEPWGVDCELVLKKTTPIPSPSYGLSSRVCQSMIRFFQVYISPIDGPRSSYYPSSSQYTLEAIQKYGVFKGIALGCDRLMRENGEDWIYPMTTGYGRVLKSDPVR